MANNKSGINRELMYQKIMPTITNPINNDTSKAATSPSISAPSIPSQEKDNETSEILGRPIEPKNVKKTVLINIMENLVLDKVDSAIARFNCCQCDKCKKDIIALTLNSLPPKYMVFSEDKMVDVIAKQTSSDVTAALVKAIIQVKNNPRH